MVALPMVPFVMSYALSSHARAREADYIGMLLMTDAGYDPAAAKSMLQTIHRPPRAKVGIVTGKTAGTTETMGAGSAKIGSACSKYLHTFYFNCLQSFVKRVLL